MRPLRAGVVLLLVQLLLVLSVAGKYLLERRTRPRIWVRAAQVDPDSPLRGRYLALQLLVNACDLPHDREHLEQGFKNANGVRSPGRWRWTVHVEARSGVLNATLSQEPFPRDGAETVEQPEDSGCERAPILHSVDYFVPEHARTPFPLKPGQQLWVEVTMPPEGPPRPIQLAVSGASGFEVLHL